jgi:hypothetical protein
MIWNTESWIHAMCALRYGRAMTYAVLSGSVDSWNGMGCSTVLSEKFCGLAWVMDAEEGELLMMGLSRYYGGARRGTWYLR